METWAERRYIWSFMFKRSIILLSFLAYSLTLIHSIVPHHHHDEDTSGHHHHQHDSKDHHHHDDDHEEKTVSHAFADAIHFPGSDIVIHAQQSERIQKLTLPIVLPVDGLKSLLSAQLKPPELNTDHRPGCYSFVHYALFLLRAPPVASNL